MLPIIDGLADVLLNNKQAEHFVGLLRHGITQANVEKDARKEANEPLLESEFGPDSTIKKQAKNFLTLGIPLSELCIHFDPKVKRDRQTAKIFGEQIGLNFPSEGELEYPEYCEENYPYLVLTREVATREKGDQQSKEIPIQGTQKNNAGAESILESRVRIFDYVENLKKNIQNNKYKHHIMIGHRTGTNGFLDAKYNRSQIDLINDTAESNVSQLDYGFLDNSGEFINLTEQDYGKQGKIKIHNKKGEIFEFDIANYQGQVNEIKQTIPNLQILTGCDIIQDTNIMNAYLTQIGLEIGGTHATQSAKYYLTIKNNTIHREVMKTILDSILSGSETSKDLTAVFIESLNAYPMDDNEVSKLMIIAYEENNDLWKYILSILYKENKSIISNPLIANIIKIEEQKLKKGHTSKIKGEIEKLNTVKEYSNIHIDTLLGNNISLADLYVPQHIKNNNQEIFSDDLVHEILTENKNIFAIRAAGGSGKTILSKYILNKCSDSHTLLEHDTLDCWIREIDLNDYNPETITSVIETPANILIVDALDEKNPSTVKSLAIFSRTEEFKKSGKKLVILGRYINDGFLYADEYTKDNRDDIEMYELQEEVDPQQYILNFTKAIKSDLQERFQKELSELVEKIDDDLQTPIIIEMLADIIKRKLISGRNKKIFIDEDGNEKKDITRKDIYDKFFEHLHKREDEKSDIIGDENNRLYQNNPFMGEEYDELRKEFLIYLTMTDGVLGTQGSWTTPQINEGGNIELWRESFEDVFRDFLLYMSDKKKENMIDDFLVDAKKGGTPDQQLHNIELFRETLLATNILKKDQYGKLSFHHKTFKDYFGYLYYLQYYSDSQDKWISFIQTRFNNFVKLRYSKLFSNQGKFYGGEEQIIPILMLPHFDSNKDILTFVDAYAESTLWRKENELGLSDYPHIIQRFLDNVLGKEKLSYIFLKNYDHKGILLSEIKHQVGSYIGGAGELTNHDGVEFGDTKEFNNFKHDMMQVYDKCLLSTQGKAVEGSDLHNDIENILKKYNVPHNCSVEAENFFFNINLSQIITYIKSGRF